MPGTIEELKGLLERSSPLPWRHNQWMNTRNNTVMADEVKSAGHVIVKDVHREEDVSLIVAAVNSLPALIACAELLKEALPWLEIDPTTEEHGLVGRIQYWLSAFDRSSKEDGR